MLLVLLDCMRIKVMVSIMAGFLFLGLMVVRWIERRRHSYAYV